MRVAIVIGLIAQGNTIYGQQLSQSTTITVDRLFELIEANDKALQAQKMGMETARSGIDAARAQRLPDVSTQLSASFLGNGFITDRNFGNFTNVYIPHFGTNFALEASQTVYSGGAVTGGIALAQLAYRQAEVQTELNRQQLRFVVLGQYLELFKLDNQIKVYKQNIALTDRLIANVKAKREQGTALANDITRYELQQETLRLGLTKLRDEYGIQNYRLCTSTGLSHSVVIKPDTTLVDKLYAQDGTAYWQQSAASSPLLRQASLSTQIASQQEKIAHAALMPKVSIVAADHLDGPITIDIPAINKNFNYWYIGIGVRYNIDALFKGNRRLKQARLATRQSEVSEIAVARQIEDNVQAAYTYYLQSFQELKTQQKSVELAQQNYRVINDRYLNALALVTDMTDAANLKLQAELQEVNARIGVVYAYYKMKYLSGNL